MEQVLLFRRMAAVALLASSVVLGGCDDDKKDGSGSVLVDQSAGVIVSEREGADPSATRGAGPQLDIPVDTLDAGLVCGEFKNQQGDVVLLVHGTFTHGEEQYNWSYKPLLEAEGYDVCTVTYPDRGFDDMQITVEYTVYAIRKIHNMTGRRVDVIGHSQGVMHPRWALAWWSDIPGIVDDMVGLAGPNHGTAIVPSALTGVLPLLLPPSVYQFTQDSEFVAALNRDDETPGDVDYTNIYTMFDELVQPFGPVPTAALDFGLSNPKVSNTLVQDVCIGRIVDHVTIGLTDAFTFRLVLDALANSGPANLERAGGEELCGLLPIVPDQVISTTLPTDFLSVLSSEFGQGIPTIPLVAAEPELRDYAR